MGFIKNEKSILNLLKLDSVVVGNKLLKNLSLKVNVHDVVLLKGLNGAGKTSLMRTIAGLMPFSDGDIYIENQKLTKNNHNSIVRESCSVLLTMPLQANGILVSDYFDLHLNQLDSSEFEKLKDLFSIQYLMDKYIDQLSDGERQKVLLIKTLSKRASLYLLDEPSTFLDYKSKEILYNYLKTKTQELNKAILICSHDLLNVEAFSNKIFLIENGSIVTWKGR
mgnify:CR=1 FL=1